MCWILGQPAERGRDREDDDADRKHLARAVDVAEPGRCDQEHRVEQAVGVEHPQDLVEAGVQSVEDRRDRDVDNGQVEQRHEEAEHEHAQRGHRMIANVRHLSSSFVSRTSRPIPSVLMSHVPNGLCEARRSNWVGAYARRLSISSVVFVVKALSHPRLIPSTSRSMSASDASLLMSWITAVPPSRRTRCISASARRGSVKFLNAAWQTTRSKESVSNSISATSPWRNSTDTLALRAFSVAISTNVRLTSRPVT